MCIPYSHVFHLIPKVLTMSLSLAYDLLFDFFIMFITYEICVVFTFHMCIPFQLAGHSCYRWRYSALSHAQFPLWVYKTERASLWLKFRISLYNWGVKCLGRTIIKGGSMSLIDPWHSETIGFTIFEHTVVFLCVFAHKFFCSVTYIIEILLTVMTNMFYIVPFLVQLHLVQKSYYTYPGVRVCVIYVKY